jgi:hypothetical protein
MVMEYASLMGNWCLDMEIASVLSVKNRTLHNKTSVPIFYPVKILAFIAFSFKSVIMSFVPLHKPILNNIRTFLKYNKKTKVLYQYELSNFSYTLQ